MSEAAEERALERDLERNFANNNELEFIRILWKYGIIDERPRFSEVLRLLRDLRSGTS
jgi:hypothetical protein